MKKKELVIILFLVLTGIFFRFYNLEKRALFFADEERDAYEVQKILRGDLTLIGPSTSVGNIYLGPGWYYFLTPWYLVFRGDPIAGKVAVGVMGVVTTLLFYILGKEIFNRKIGFWAAFIYGSCLYLVEQTNRAWNPSMMPLVSLLFFYGLFKIKNKEKKYWWLVVLCLGLGIQFHLTAVFLFLVLLIFVFKYKVKFSFDFFIYGLFFLFLISPLIVFDLRHNFWNTKALFLFLENLIKGGDFGEQKIVVNSYYFLVFYPIIIFWGGYFISKLFFGKWGKVLKTGIIVLFLGINYCKLVEIDKKDSLYYKKKIVKRGIEEVGKREFELLLPENEQLARGFRYLFYFYGKEPVKSSIDFDYRHFYKVGGEKPEVAFSICEKKRNYCGGCGLREKVDFGNYSFCVDSLVDIMNL